MSELVSVSATYSLKYFGIRGVVEATRIMFAIANQPYQDIRLSREEFAAHKANGEYYINMDRVPILTYNGVLTIGQSKTIDRFVAKKLGFAGMDESESVMIDMISEHLRDIKQKYSDCKVGKSGEELEIAKASFLNKDFPIWMDKLEKCLGPSGYAVGSKLSLADIYIQQLVQDYFDDKGAAAAGVANCPKIQASCEVVAEAAKNWFDSRPVTAV